jgi:hypothetical protein
MNDSDSLIRVVKALENLLEDLIDADEHVNQETGEPYGSVIAACQVLDQIAGNSVWSDRIGYRKEPS